VPLDGLKLSRRSPLNRIEKETVDTRRFTISTHIRWKPNLSMIAGREDLSVTTPRLAEEIKVKMRTLRRQDIQTAHGPS
jgi:hypothetical protein